MSAARLKGAWICALLAAAALAAPALADATIAPPAEKFAVSPGGVDMRSGRYVYEQTDLTIGGEGGALSLSRTLAQPVAGHANPFANFSHNWDVLISEKRINIDQNVFTHGIGNPDYQIEVTFGGLSQTFRGHGTAGYDGGESAVVVYQMTPGPALVVDPLGRRTVTDYCDPNAMANLPPSWHHRCYVSPAAVSTTDPEGIRTELGWDFVTRNLQQTRQIARPDTLQPNGQPWPVITRSATYNCQPAYFRSCARPVTVTDARGAVTEFTYSPDHGGLLTETGPAPADGAPRPQIRHEYAPRHAWILSGGGYVQMEPPIWVRTATSLCRTSAATGNPCAAAGDEVRTAYLYGPDSGPNNLLLRGQEVSATDGSATTTLRTCYTYDRQGRRISETQPEANPASCP